MIEEETAKAFVRIDVALGSDLMGCGCCDKAFIGHIQNTLEMSLVHILEDLGIRLKPVIKVLGSTSSGPLEVSVQGHTLAYPQSLVREVFEYVSYQGTLPLSYSWDDWIKENLESAVVGNRQTSEFLIRLVLEAIKRQPKYLISVERTNDISNVTSSLSEALSSDYHSLRVLQLLLCMRIALPARMEDVQDVLDSSGSQPRFETVAECLISRLRPHRVELCLHPDYLSSVFGVKDGRISLDSMNIDLQIRNQFRDMRYELFDELGIRLSDIELIATDDLMENGFSVRLNNQEGMPYRGLPSDGLNALPHIVRIFKRILRQDAWCLLDTETVLYELALLHEAFPELILAVLESISIEYLTQILRELLREGIAIRDLKAILERNLTFDSVAIDCADCRIYDDRLVIHERLSTGPKDSVQNRVDYIRLGLKQYISNKYSNGQNVVFVYSPDQEKIEHRILDHLASESGDHSKRPLTRADIERVLAGFRAELGSLQQSDNFPVVLTIPPIRAFLRALLKPELPDLAVLSYDELTLNLKVERVATIVPA